ncbi:hypothetical protein JCM10213v2_001433 [Rhodosporidiobolus nylandii]
MKCDGPHKAPCKRCRVANVDCIFDSPAAPATSKATSKVRSNAQALALLEGRVGWIEGRLEQLDLQNTHQPSCASSYSGSPQLLAPSTPAPPSRYSLQDPLPSGLTVGADGAALQSRVAHLEAQVRALQGLVHQLLPPSGYPPSTVHRSASFSSSTTFHPQSPAHILPPPLSSAPAQAGSFGLPPGGAQRWSETSFSAPSDAVAPSISYAHHSAPAAFTHLQLHVPPPSSAHHGEMPSPFQQPQQLHYPSPDLPSSGQAGQFSYAPSPVEPPPMGLYQPQAQYPQHQAGVEALLAMQHGREGGQAHEAYYPSGSAVEREVQQ